MFKTDHFEVSGNASVHQVRFLSSSLQKDTYRLVPQDVVDNHRYVLGGLAFIVPGIQELVTGNFIAVNKTSQDEAGKANFDNFFKHVDHQQQTQENQGVPDLAVVAESLSKTLKN